MDKTTRELFEVNVKNIGLLGEFSSDYRIDHIDRDGNFLRVGDRVFIDNDFKDSWTHRRIGIVLKLGVVAMDGKGHLLQMFCGITVVSLENLLLIKEG
jgi:hypothetical protein